MEGTPKSSILIGLSLIYILTNHIRTGHNLGIDSGPTNGLSKAICYTVLDFDPYPNEWV
jgi:hypothetical protein